MLKIFVICALIGLATALPGETNSNANAEVVSRHEDVRADGFVSGVEITNSIKEERQGDEHGNIKGSYSYDSPEGEHIGITYVADEHGFQPKGDHLPTPPPVPVEIVKALEYIAAHPSVENH